MQRASRVERAVPPPRSSRCSSFALRIGLTSLFPCRPFDAGRAPTCSVCRGDCNYALRWHLLLPLFRVAFRPRSVCAAERCPQHLK
jgi:hypothetical protein